MRKVEKIHTSWELKSRSNILCVWMTTIKWPLHFSEYKHVSQRRLRTLRTHTRADKRHQNLLFIRSNLLFYLNANSLFSSLLSSTSPPVVSAGRQLHALFIARKILRRMVWTLQIFGVNKRTIVIVFLFLFRFFFLILCCFRRSSWEQYFRDEFLRKYTRNSNDFINLRCRITQKSETDTKQNLKTTSAA